jgi:hypothetical protein
MSLEFMIKKKIILKKKLKKLEYTYLINIAVSQNAAR